MTDGDDDEATEAPEASEDDAGTEPALDPESFETRLNEVAEDLEGAETEGDLDAVAATIETIEEDLAQAELPEPDEDDEDAADPAAEIEDRIASVREDLEAARGPYADDVVTAIEDHQATLRETRWTEQGHSDIEAAVTEFIEDVAEILDADFDAPSGESAALADGLDSVKTAITEAELDPDDDADVVASLVDAAAALDTGLEDAQEWDDLDTRGQLRAEGFYDSLETKHKDFPPEWSALKAWENKGNVEMVLLALEQLDSDFMERHCMEALERMGDPAAIETVLGRAERRDKQAIRILGQIGEPREGVVETLVDFLGTDSDPALERVTITALGKMGADDAVAPIADRLAAENPRVRSTTARGLGLLGATQAIEPLGERLAGDEDDTVRASAAWALVQIGTKDALETAAAHADDRTYLVASEAAPAATALETAEPTA
ncbi:MAG: HEAT repeat domain-containing protein [Halobacteriaceae archaeon]